MTNDNYSNRGKLGKSSLISLLIILFSLLIESCCQICPRCRGCEPVCNPNNIPNPGHCTKVDTLISAGPDTSVSKYHYLRYRCNQIILDKSHPDALSLRNYLKNRCFQPIDTCPCGQRFELWEYPSVVGVDVAPPPAQPPPRPSGIGGGLMYNVIFDLPDTLSPGSVDSILEKSEPLSCINIKNTVNLAIVDSGVDPQNDPTINHLLHYSWVFYNYPNRCIPASNSTTRGMLMDGHSSYGEPDDVNGHGTSVNAVATGASYPNFKTDSFLKFVNIRITENNSKSSDLFTALCGLYYALNQQPDIINISWGFSYNITDRTSDYNDGIVKAFNDFFTAASNENTLIVAGIGNDSSRISATFKFYPACLASQNKNVISVGATESTNNIARFSNFCQINNSDLVSSTYNIRNRNFPKPNDYVTVFAPGKSIVTAYPVAIQNAKGRRTTGWERQSGTSFATPYVSRVAALIKSVNPTMLPVEIKSKLMDLCQIHQSSSRHGFYYRTINRNLIYSNICPPN